ncbi:MIP/aquaporin family protein [Convivina praedatoris]|uniref:Aquaporin Z n=1 Tax=Convivina praedatoris TaxID=2880963 RepID=A0ABM9D3B5_9LACO|nr:aquaporin [Convivina sp. LMG 32447]CAH1856963.1 Aquaporin Z [Convivina sp. LMG 32447]CAH1857436.1 Aquaporin Z [Convivina sp. LMG 32447]
MRKYLAEFLGTLLFMLFAGASIIYLTAFNFAQIFDIMLTFGLALMTSMFIWGPWANGGHFNPAVSIGAAITGQITWKTCLGYTVAQLLGGITGLGFTIAGINGLSNIQKSASQNISTTQILSSLHPTSSDLLAPYTFGVELVLTFFLVLVILLAIQEHPRLSPVIAGTFLTLTMFTAFPLSGGALNPVRVIASIFYTSNQAGSFIWIYLAAQLLAAVLAGGVLRIFYRPTQA